VPGLHRRAPHTTHIAAFGNSGAFRQQGFEAAQDLDNEALRSLVIQPLVVAGGIGKPNTFSLLKQQGFCLYLA
jgi:hypothetical protein